MIIFKDIYGQNKIVSNLSKAIEAQKNHHAYIFNGRSGLGKKAIALEMMKILNCSKRKSSEPYCGKCSSCLKLSHFTSENFIMLFPEKSEPTSQERDLTDSMIMEMIKEKGYSDIEYSGKFITIDKVKSIKDFALLNTIDGKYRFVLIDQADRMNKEAQNSLLKILEEPPKNFLFFLITENKSAFLPTIISRCNVTDFSPISDGELERFLKEKKLGSDNRYVSKADGSLSLLKKMYSGYGEKIAEKELEFLSIMENSTPPDTVDLLEKFIADDSGSDKKGKLSDDILKEILSGFIFRLRNIYLIKGHNGLLFFNKICQMTNELIYMNKRNINQNLLFLNFYLNYREEYKNCIVVAVKKT
ncbi:MAG: DNA polymerase III subunit [Candidatus Delongbacteria bacterium]|nr:DNA polymerase III subunit [Candidatus Delongbacteria bacterium]MBN2833766.1 DNA polymerase III subunit [Candidatus Delongbacteria bacterium]